MERRGDDGSRTSDVRPKRSVRTTFCICTFMLSSTSSNLPRYLHAPHQTPPREHHAAKVTRKTAVWHSAANSAKGQTPTWTRCTRTGWGAEGRGSPVKGTHKSPVFSSHDTTWPWASCSSLMGIPRMYGIATCSRSR